MMDKKKKKDLLVVERRFLLVAFACGILAAVLFLISFCAEFWVWVEFPTADLRNDTDREPLPFYKVGHYHGLWKICRQEFRNSSDSIEPYYSDYCRPMYFHLPSWIKEEVRDIETKILDFRRSTIAVGFISLVLSIIANCFVYFSLDQLRYMYKRLSGCLILITGASAWVTMEVFKQCAYFEERHMHNQLAQSKTKFGWCYNLIWVVLVLDVFDGVTMLVCSRKRKGVKARSLKEARENEPVYLGRI